MENNSFVKASEIGEYVYCPGAWWLRFTGLLPAKTAAMSEGTAKHEQLATRLEVNHRQTRIALLLIVLGVALFAGLLLIYLVLHFP